MIHHHNGALMAAVKIIFDRPALSWPLSFLFVFLSLSLLSLFFPTILSVTHSKIGRACNTSASDTTIPIKILPVKHLLTWHTLKHHVYFLGSHQLWPFLSLHSCIWPILGSVFSWWRSRAESRRQQTRRCVYLFPAIWHLLSLQPCFFWATAVKRHSHYLSSTCKHQEAHRFTQTTTHKKMTASCKDN